MEELGGYEDKIRLFFNTFIIFMFHVLHGDKGLYLPRNYGRALLN